VGRPHPILFTLTVLLLSLMSSALCAGVYIAVEHWTLPPTDMAYGMSLAQTFADPFVRAIATEGAILVAVGLFPVAVVCLWRRDLVRCGVFSVALSLGYLVAFVPFANGAVFLAPLVTLGALVFCRSTHRTWFIGPVRDPATQPAGRRSLG
jgi:hypothetical protein